MIIIVTVKIFCVCNIQVWHFCSYEALMIYFHTVSVTSVSYKKTLQCSYSGLCEVHLLHIKSNCHVRQLKQWIFFKMNSFKNSLTHNNLVITLSTFIQSSKASVQDWQNDTKFVECISNLTSSSFPGTSAYFCLPHQSAFTQASYVCVQGTELHVL